MLCIHKIGQPLALPPNHGETKYLATTGSHFDFPTKFIGKSKWLGSDGKPVNILVDPSLGAAGEAVAQNLLTRIDDAMASCDVWFGVRGQGGNCIIAPAFGGAYHYGCSFTNGGDWYLSMDTNDVILGLALAEITESYMGLQGKGWNCGGSGGEGLSRVLAETGTGGPNGAMKDFATGSAWDGTDWISRDQGTDQDFSSTGCAVLYLYWMLSQGFKLEQIVQTGEPGKVLAGNYAALTGKAASSAIGAFRSATPRPASGDNPYNAPLPAYPATAAPPPAPPPPAPNPSPSGQFHFAISMVNTPPHTVNMATYSLDPVHPVEPMHGLNFHLPNIDPAAALLLVTDALKIVTLLSAHQYALAIGAVQQLLADLKSHDPTPDSARRT